MIRKKKRLASLLYPLVTVGFAAWVGGAAAGSGTSHNGDKPHEHASMHAAEAASPDAACRLHDGTVSMAGRDHFETVAGPDGIRVYRYTAKQVPAMAKSVSGTVELSFADGARKEIPLGRTDAKEGEATAYFCPGHPQATRMEPGICEACGSMQLMAQDHLFGRWDIASGASRPTKAVVHLRGLGGEEKEVTFSVALDTPPPTEAPKG